jgi:uncharacterized 2Fe-2S/4Fe-4S cluster protein (DUF4445 family)
MTHTTVVFQPEGRRVVVSSRETLLHAALRCGAGIEDLCGGLGTCGKCKVIVHHGRDLLSLPTEAEGALVGEDPRRGVRWACQTHPLAAGTVVLEVPPEAQRSWQRLQTAGWSPSFMLDPEVRKVPAPRTISEKTLRHARWVFPPGSTAWVREAAHESGPRRLLVRGRTVFGITRPREPIWGMAYDVGSTKVAGYLLDLERGQVIQSLALPNPQIVHGEDIMSRLAYALGSPTHAEQLRQEVIETLNRILRAACGRAKGSRSRVSTVAIVGNTAMHHFLLGASVESLARTPYRPSVEGEWVTTAGFLGLDIPAPAPVILPSVVGAFVGSDLVAGVRATRMDRARALSALIDVGTNTEICIGDRKRLLACSTPSGPAFEGAHIRFGMRAADGAVERVSIAPGTWKVAYRVIGRKKPRGLCGSALLDLLSELQRVGAVDRTGRLTDAGPSDAIVTVQGGRAFRVIPAAETAIGQDLVITQGDIGQLQLAKAAIRAAIELLLAELRRTPEEIHTFSLAGAFGSYLAPESALRVGMIPPTVPLSRIRFVGNTAGSGARLVLFSGLERRAMASLASSIRHVPLAGDPRFAGLFARALSLPEGASGPISAVAAHA